VARCSSGAVHFMLSVQGEHDVHGTCQPGIGLVPAARTHSNKGNSPLDLKMKYIPIFLWARHARPLTLSEPVRFWKYMSCNAVPCGKGASNLPTYSVGTSLRCLQGVQDKIHQIDHDGSHAADWLPGHRTACSVVRQ